MVDAVGVGWAAAAQPGAHLAVCGERGGAPWRSGPRAVTDGGWRIAALALRPASSVPAFADHSFPLRVSGGTGPIKNWDPPLSLRSKVCETYINYVDIGFALAR